MKNLLFLCEMVIVMCLFSMFLYGDSFIYSITMYSPTNQSYIRVKIPVIDGVCGQGIAIGFNSTVHIVDANGLKVEKDKVEGEINITFRFDGYLPLDGKNVLKKYKITGVKKEGEYICDEMRGRWSGETRELLDFSGYWMMDLCLENGANKNILSKKSWSDRTYLKVLLKDCKPVQILSYGHGQRAQVNFFQSEVIENNLSFTSEKIDGEVILKSIRDNSIYVWKLKGIVVGDFIAGDFTKKVNNEEVPGGVFKGSLEKFLAQNHDNAVYYLELHGVMDHGEQLFAFIPRTNGTFNQGVGYCAGYNKTFHEVDTSELKLNKDELTGDIFVTYLPDPYVPPDKKPVKAFYTITAKVIDSRYVTGRFSGRFRDIELSGPVFGELHAHPVIPDPVSIYLKMEDGVNDGAPWFRRVFVSFTARNGETTDGSMSNNKGGWKGKFKHAKVNFDGSCFTATVEGVVEESKGPKIGEYKFELTGRIVDNVIVGTVTTFLNGEKTKSGTPFMGSFSTPRKVISSEDEEQ